MEKIILELFEKLLKDNFKKFLHGYMEKLPGKSLQQIQNEAIKKCQDDRNYRWNLRENGEICGGISWNICFRKECLKMLRIISWNMFWKNLWRIIWSKSSSRVIFRLIIEGAIKECVRGIAHNSRTDLLMWIVIVLFI